MDEPIEELVIDVRATTEGFARDIGDMRTRMDTTLLDGFERAGNVLERGLLGAIRRGSLGFDDLKRVAFNALNEIAAQAVQTGIGSLFGGGQAGGGGGVFGNLLSGTVGALFGLPGRATGGPVAPGSAYVVGERGPEVFVPTSAGRVVNGESNGRSARDVRVAIQLNTPRGASAPTAMRRSSRQVASAVRQALADI
ncbi:tail tape measure protein [Erythrobacter sp. HA6-11]